MTTSAPDGSVVIDTKIDGKGFNVGMKKLQESARASLNSVASQMVKSVGPGIRDGLAKIASAGAAIFKKLLLGGLLVFALSARNIFAALRESISEVIKLRGGDTAKSVEQIKNSFEELKAAIALAFLPLIEAAIPYIKQALAWLIELFNRVAMISAAFLGQKQALQIIQGSAQKIADANKKSEKAARGQLAAFDQINVLQKSDTGADAKDLPKVAAELVPVTDDILSKVQAIKDEIAEWFADPVGKLKETWGKVVDWFKENVFNPIARWWADTWLSKNVVEPLLKWFSDAWLRISLGATTLWGNLKEIFGALAPLLLAVFTPALELLGNAVQTVFDVIVTRFTMMKELFASIVQVWTGVIEFLAGALTGNWQKAWTGISNIFTGIIGGWKAMIKGTFNSMIDIINGLLRAVVIGINSVSSALNSIQFDVPDWVPVIGGSSFSLGIPVVTAPQIPHLATGAVIPPNSQFAAILGDQTSGRNIETPEDLLRQIISEQLGNIQADIHISFDGNMGTFVRELKPHIDRETVRIGGSLIKSGVST